MKYADIRAAADLLRQRDALIETNDRLKSAYRISIPQNSQLYFDLNGDKTNSEFMAIWHRAGCNEKELGDLLIKVMRDRADNALRSINGRLNTLGATPL